MKNLRARFEESLAQVLEPEIEDSPFQLALTEAYRRSEPALASWQRWTANVVGELASRLFGTLTEGNLREAMRSADIFLSIGILFTTLQARRQPENFLDALKELGIAGLAETTAKLVRICGSLPEDATISEVPMDVARQNDGVARACIAKKSAFTAVAYLLQILCSRVGLVNKIQLGKWVLRHTQSGRKILADPAAYLGRNTMDAEKILALVVPVEIGLLASLPQFGEPPATGSKQIRTTPDLSTFQVSGTKFSEISHAMQTLTKSIPAEFRHALGQAWLEEKVRIVDDGPKGRNQKTTSLPVEE